jgi:hypothetical protein
VAVRAAIAALLLLAARLAVAHAPALAVVTSSETIQAPAAELERNEFARRMGLRARPAAPSARTHSRRREGGSRSSRSAASRRPRAHDDETRRDDALPTTCHGRPAADVAFPHVVRCREPEGRCRPRPRRKETKNTFPRAVIAGGFLTADAAVPAPPPAVTNEPSFFLRRRHHPYHGVGVCVSLTALGSGGRAGT